MSDWVSERANVAAFYDSEIIGENRESHGDVHVNLTGVPYAIKLATQTNDLMALTNALADGTVGSWLFEGHSGPVSIIAGTDHYLHATLRATDLASILGNSFSTPIRICLIGLAFSQP